MSEYITPAQTAKYVRQALKQAFPDVLFSVRTKTYSGGASINIGWTDGPSAPLVDRVVMPFAGSFFDSSKDYKGTRTHMLHGKAVRFGADFVFVHREFSDAQIEKAVAKVVRQYGWSFPASYTGTPTAADFRNGALIHVEATGHRSLQGLIRETLWKMSDRMHGKSTLARSVMHIANDGRALESLQEA